MREKFRISCLLSLKSAWTSFRQGATIESLANVMIISAGGTLFAMMAIMTAYIIGRKLGEPIPGAFEASEQFMVLVFSFPLAAVGLRKGHIVFELFSTRLSSRNRAKLGIISDSVGILLIGAMTWKGWQIGWERFIMREYRQGIIDFPIWPFRIALALGLTVFTIQLIVSLVRTMKVIGGPERK